MSSTNAFSSSSGVPSLSDAFNPITSLIDAEGGGLLAYTNLPDVTGAPRPFWWDKFELQVEGHFKFDYPLGEVVDIIKEFMFMYPANTYLYSVTPAAVGKCVVYVAAALIHKEGVTTMFCLSRDLGTPVCKMTLLRTLTKDGTSKGDLGMVGIKEVCFTSVAALQLTYIRLTKGLKQYLPPASSPSDFFSRCVPVLMDSVESSPLPESSSTSTMSHLHELGARLLASVTPQEPSDTATGPAASPSEGSTPHPLVQ
jgi:hypothetical protein